MKIYNYDGTTKEFISATEGEIDFTGMLSMPANATKIMPLNRAGGLLSGYVNIFNEAEQEWSQIEDMRKEVYNKFDGVEYLNRFISAIPDSATLLVPYEDSKWDEEQYAWVDDLDAMYLRESNKIKEDHGLQEAEGIILVGISEELDGIKMDCSYFSVRKLKAGLELSVMIDPNPDTIMKVRTFDNNTIRITNQEVEKIIKFLGIQVQKRLGEKWTKQDVLDTKYGK